MKSNEQKEHIRLSPAKKFYWIEKHQRSNNDEIPEYDNLYDPNIEDSKIATERHVSSLIENFDQSEFIKNVIIQSNKPGWVRFGSPGQSNPSSSNSGQFERKKEDKSFIKDMKKYGILKAFNDINKFTEFFQNSPNSNQEIQNQINENHKHWSSGNLEWENHSSSMQEIVEAAAQEKNTKSTYLLEEMENEEKNQNSNLKNFKFIFPFQRRARSHSPPKNSVITNKIIETMNNNSPEGVLGQNANNANGDNSKKQGTKNKPVVANPNFLIGSYHLLNKKEKLQSYINDNSWKEVYGNDEHILQGKEVEEWLMGSGNSIPEGTTGWTDSSDINKLFSSNLSCFLNTLKFKQSEKEQEQQFESTDQKLVEECEELDEWMFDSLNPDKEQLDNTDFQEIDSEWIPDESGLDGNWLENLPVFPNPNKRSPYIYRDQVIEEEDELENEFVDSNEQFGFKNLNSYIKQMDRWIEEGKSFK